MPNPVLAHITGPCIICGEETTNRSRGRSGSRSYSHRRCPPEEFDQCADRRDMRRRRPKHHGAGECLTSSPTSPATPKGTWGWRRFGRKWERIAGEHEATVATPDCAIIADWHDGAAKAIRKLLGDLSSNQTDHPQEPQGERSELSDWPEYERVARAFHATYEAAAPDYDYETRSESRKLWAEVPHKNRMLMVGTVRRLAETGVIAIPEPES